MTIPDSNIWIGYFYSDDPHHLAARKFLRGQNWQNITLTEYIVLEVTTILKQKKGFALANTFLHSVEEFGIPVLLSEHFYHKTVKLFRSLKEKHLSFVDVSLLALSEEYDIMTFDKHLKKLIRE